MRLDSTKETYHFMEPANCSHSDGRMVATLCRSLCRSLLNGSDGSPIAMVPSSLVSLLFSLLHRLLSRSHMTCVSITCVFPLFQREKEEREDATMEEREDVIERKEKTL